MLRCLHPGRCPPPVSRCSPSTRSFHSKRGVFDSRPRIKKANAADVQPFKQIVDLGIFCNERDGDRLFRKLKKARCMIFSLRINALCYVDNRCALNASVFGFIKYPVHDRELPYTMMLISREYSELTTLHECLLSPGDRDEAHAQMKVGL